MSSLRSVPICSTLSRARFFNSLEVLINALTATLDVSKQYSHNPFGGDASSTTILDVSKQYSHKPFGGDASSTTLQY